MTATATTEQVNAWVHGYIDAWESNDSDLIGALFTEDARYLTAPFHFPWVGREAIVAGWLERQDTLGNQHFAFNIVGISDDFAFVQGFTQYHSPTSAYTNLWVIRLDDRGRCAEFTEWLKGVRA